MYLISPGKFLIIRLALVMYLLYFLTGLWSHSMLIFSADGLFPHIHPWLKINPLYIFHIFRISVFFKWFAFMFSWSTN